MKRAEALWRTFIFVEISYVSIGNLSTYWKLQLIVPLQDHLFKNSKFLSDNCSVRTLVNIKGAFACKIHFLFLFTRRKGHKNEFTDKNFDRLINEEHSYCIWYYQLIFWDWKIRSELIWIIWKYSYFGNEFSDKSASMVLGECV